MTRGPPPPFEYPGFVVWFQGKAKEYSRRFVSSSVPESTRTITGCQEEVLVFVRFVEIAILEVIFWAGWGAVNCGVDFAGFNSVKWYFSNFSSRIQFWQYVLLTWLCTVVIYEAFVLVHSSESVLCAVLPTDKKCSLYFVHSGKLCFFNWRFEVSSTFF